MDETQQRSMAEDTVRAVYRAFGSGAPEAIAAMAAEYFGEGIVIREAESLPWGGVYEGLETASAMAAGISSPQSPIVAAELIIERLITGSADADGAVQVVAVTSFPWRGAGGTIPMRAMEWFTVRAGKVEEIQIFLWDTSAALAALG
jgi:hypothetical protein